ncbi:divalent-cation tolerance protein CutA [Leptospira idonii]|uniref:Divalent-cation tolerance protein CutA n=1 Tax=Leptospira idonii TaxID=1193500 RepID=A0A4R9LXH3_9LEPT|nr:divalent-cation tolerance protein CutA [Leptospira idonii]TGN19013.1 divalent-cation tolerance protein CutA [Leptospira idonii]
MNDLKLIYVTVGSLEEAKKIATTIVSEKKAACANILHPMTSFYFWKGELQEDSEIVLIFKTKEATVGSLTERIKELHSYEVPCVVSLPIESGNTAYLDWIRNSV